MARVFGPRTSPARNVGNHRNLGRAALAGTGASLHRGSGGASSSVLRFNIHRCGIATTPSAVGLAAVFTFAIFGIIIAALAPCALGANPEGMEGLMKGTTTQAVVGNEVVTQTDGVTVAIHTDDERVELSGENEFHDYLTTDEYQQANNNKYDSTIDNTDPNNNNNNENANQMNSNILANQMGHSIEQQPGHLSGQDLVGLTISYASLSIVVILGFGVYLAHVFWCRRQRASVGKTVMGYGVAMAPMYPSYPSYTLRDIDLSEASTPISRDPATKLAAELLVTIV